MRAAARRSHRAQGAVPRQSTGRGARARRLRRGVGAAAAARGRDAVRARAGADRSAVRVPAGGIPADPRRAAHRAGALAAGHVRGLVPDQAAQADPALPAQGGAAAGQVRAGRGAAGEARRFAAAPQRQRHAGAQPAVAVRCGDQAVAGRTGRGDGGRGAEHAARLAAPRGRCRRSAAAAYARPAGNSGITATLARRLRRRAGQRDHHRRACHLHAPPQRDRPLRRVRPAPPAASARRSARPDADTSRVTPRRQRPARRPPARRSSSARPGTPPSARAPRG